MKRVYIYYEKCERIVNAKLEKKKILNGKSTDCEINTDSQYINLKKIAILKNFKYLLWKKNVSVKINLIKKYQKSIFKKNVYCVFS